MDARVQINILEVAAIASFPDKLPECIACCSARKELPLSKVSHDHVLEGAARSANAIGEASPDSNAPGIPTQSQGLCQSKNDLVPKHCKVSAPSSNKQQSCSHHHHVDCCFALQT